MTTDQSNHVVTYDTTIEYVGNTNAISGLRPGLIAGTAQLAAIVATIKETAAKQSTQTGGAATDKDIAKSKYAVAIFNNTAGTASYAASINNNTLKEEMHYSLSDLQRMGDERILIVGANIRNIIAPLLLAVPPTTLADFGVDAASMSAMADAQEAYLEEKNKPRGAIVTKSTQTELLKPLFKAANKVMHDIMDPVALTLKKEHEEWYTGYHNSTKVIDYGTRHTTVEGDCVVSGTETKIYNALIILTSIDHPEVRVHSDVNGHWKQIPIKFGVWSISVTHPDYDEVTIAAFQIKLGESIFKQINMVPKIV